MAKQLDGRVALVTGAGSGIGAAAAKLLAREGARVACVSRTQEQLDAVVAEIHADGGEAMTVVADVSNADQVERAVRQTVDTWGRLDVVFANAGVNGVWAPLEELEPAEWEKTIAINLHGTFYTVKYAVPHLKKQGGGSVIVCASINGTRVFSNTGASAYASSKAAQVAFTKMVALELARDRVRVNVICPGAIDTQINDSTEQRHTKEAGIPVEFPLGNHPLAGKPGSSEQVAQLVLFLASDASNHISGTEVWIDGAESLIGMRG
ncbi:MAG TPA: SDR family NAD(P)-dependent oxidoreductase [Longimicrobiaceae bacterium]|nr:SDR family NAD(P)-dependent oxidoreductase [Longimicrobiaceae bacterium]